MIPTDTHEHPLVSVMLLLLGATSYIVQDITADSLYVWTFRAMSLLSLACIILINRKKAWEEFKEMFR